MVFLSCVICALINVVWAVIRIMGVICTMGGFTVQASELAAGSKEVARQKDGCVSAASSATGALSEMAGAAGHPGLAGALTGAAQTGFKAFLDASAAYGHVAEALSNSASAYASTDEAITAKVRGVLGRF